MYDRFNNLLCVVFFCSLISAPYRFFDYPLNSRIGLAACILGTSEGIAQAVHHGFDLVTYKTIRSHYAPIVSPHVYPVNCDSCLSYDDIGARYYASQQNSCSATRAITNSFGINCAHPDEVVADIAQARQSLHEGQVLIVSVYGSGDSVEHQAADFAAAATLAYQGGAHCIEANLSCPHVGGQGLVYQNPETVAAICKAIDQAVPSLPLIIKVGIFENKESLRATLRAAAQAGARGVCGINTVPVRVVDEHERAVFGPNRPLSGLSGAPIHNLAVQFARDARAIINEEHLDLVLLVTGGVLEPEQFDDFLEAGADYALCATGALFNISLARDYHVLHAKE